LSHSQGFHAHPKVTFAAAPPVGEESEGDYMDVVLCARVKPGDLLDRVRATLPKGFHIYDVVEVPTNAPSLMSLVSGFDYTLVTQGDAGGLQTRIDELLAMETINIERKGRPTGVRRSRETSILNIRPTLHTLAVRSGEGSEVAVDFRTRQVDGKLAKPREIIALLGLDPATTRVLKRETHFA